MKSYLIKGLYFMIPILVISISYELLLRNIPNDYRLKKNYLDNHASEIETLILGSSHALFGINPEYLNEKSFNAANVSQTLDIDFKLLKKYDARLDGLQQIILPISYFSLFENLNSWRLKNYCLYFDLSVATSVTHYSELLSHPFRDNSKRLINYYLKGDSAVTCSEKGWGTIFSSDKALDLEKTGRDAALRHAAEDITSAEIQSILNENTQTLADLMHWCASNQVKLILITPPAYKSYRNHLEKTQLEKTITTAKQTCATHQICSYYNLIDDDRFTEDDFFDGDHLSEIGAEKLTKILDSISESINL